MHALVHANFTHSIVYMPMHLLHLYFTIFVYTIGMCHTVQRAPQGAALLARLLRQPTGAVEVSIDD